MKAAFSNTQPLPFYVHCMPSLLDAPLVQATHTLGVTTTSDHVTQFYIKVVLFETAGSVIVYKIGRVGV